MEIILIQDVEHLGGVNEVVKVKNGYARNFLFPKKLAIEANSSNLKQLEERLKQLKKKEEKMMAEISSVIAKLKDGSLKINAKAGTSGKIFGTVTTLQISRAISEQKGFQIDRKKITLPTEVKELGAYIANIDFGNNQTTDIDFEVISE